MLVQGNQSALLDTTMRHSAAKCNKIETLNVNLAAGFGCLYCVLINNDYNLLYLNYKAKSKMLFSTVINRGTSIHII